ncbi:hypothetical protein ACTPOE_14590 [Castellaniella sp. WN]
MNERRIDLNIGLGRNMPDPERRDPGGPRREASDADRQAFEQALARDGGAPPEAAESWTGAHRPFPLFPGPAASVAASAPPAAPIGLARALNEAADRVLVGEGGGRREVRLDLKAEVLPGVVLSVYEEEGRMVAAFSCASEASRETLDHCAQALADEWARSLARSVLVRVGTDDPEDPCPREAAAAV